MNVVWNGVTLILEVAFSATFDDIGVWDSALWDDATWGPDIVWSDVSTWLRGFSTRIGRTSETGHYQAGTATFVLANNDARFTPDNLAGPYVSAGVTGVRPNRPVRFRAVYDGVTYAVFYGRVERFTHEFPGNTDATTTLTCVDGHVWLSSVDGFEQSAQGSGELAGPRIHRVLDNAGWDLGRSIDVGANTMQPTTLAQNARAEVLLTADSDGGAVWVDPDGTLVYEDADALVRNSRSNTVQATFDDSSGVRFRDVTFEHSSDPLVNYATLARAGGTQQVYDDLDSRALYGEAVFSRSDLVCEDDTQVSILAQRMVVFSAQPQQRVRSVEIMPLRSPAGMWPHALGRRIRDRVRVRVEVPGTGVFVDRQCFIDGVEHVGSPSNWVTTFHTSSAEPYPSAEQIGVWDDANWDEAYWGV